MARSTVLFDSNDFSGESRFTYREQVRRLCLYQQPVEEVGCHCSPCARSAAFLVERELLLCHDYTERPLFKASPLFNPSKFRELVSGRRRGLFASLLRVLLRLAEIPYTWIIRLRNRRYDRFPAKIRRVGVPVISVGNLTAGGTGKTPLVEWLARWFRRQNIRVAIISRGYGAEAGSKNDEALELEQKLPDVPHLQNPNRVEAAQTAIEELDSELILLDDAFQHRRIARDLEIVLVDALEPYGFGHLLPRGTLREPLVSLVRADVVALSRSDMVSPEERASIAKKITQYAPQAAWLELAHRPQALLSAGSNEQPLDAWKGRRVAAFCGIGNPTGFRHTLQACGLLADAFREFSDHHDYTRDDVESLSQWVDSLESIEAVVCTHKDLVKIRVDRLGKKPLFAVTISMEIVTGEELLEAKLRSFLTD